MAKEILAVPEENLEEVIKVIETGLWHLRTQISKDTFRNLEKWCKDEKDYLRRLQK